MKILDDKRANWRRQFRCADCTSTIEISVDDVRIGEFGGAYCEPGDLLSYDVCPCGAQQKIKVPAWVERIAQAKRRR